MSSRNSQKSQKSQNEILKNLKILKIHDSIISKISVHPSQSSQNSQPCIWNIILLILPCRMVCNAATVPQGAQRVPPEAGCIGPTMLATRRPSSPLRWTGARAPAQASDGKNIMWSVEIETRSRRDYDFWVMMFEKFENFEARFLRFLRCSKRNFWEYFPIETRPDEIQPRYMVDLQLKPQY